MSPSEHIPLSSIPFPDERHTLHRPLHSVIRRNPVTVAPDNPLRQALEIMNAQRIGSVVVVDPANGKPLGVFTLRDLLVRVALEKFNLEQPVANVMSGGNLVTLTGQATAYQAGLLMARHGLHRILVVDDDGRLLGLVSQGDLFALERAGVKEVSGDIRAAHDLVALQHAAQETQRLAASMLDQGVGAEQLTHFISTLNDLLTIRIIELTESEFNLPKVEWCWLAFGSEGRFEQTLSTDQDNGIIFAVAEDGAHDTDELRQAFLPFARAVNEKLDACGFPLCKGNVMASNPELCLSLEEWQSKFGSWLHAAHPQALLNATIYFDFRPLYGAEALAERLRTWLLERTGEANLFLRFMAGNALHVELPLGLIRDFVYEKNGEFPHTLELKASGSRPFVDAARIFALAAGVRQTGTAQRLRAVAEKMRLGREDVAAIIEGFYFILLLRLRHQQEGGDESGANRIDPDQLNELERTILKEAFKQAKKLQSRLQLDFRL
jgi:CBS domain-containing protein